jgi:nucleotide-binding universal stress UspA family protein/anti-anti-sigma regulatory factor
MIVETYEDVIVLSGPLRSNYWDTIHTAISLVLKRHRTGVIIDCSGITEATPEGVETFRDAMAFIQSHDARVIVANVSPALDQVFRVVPEVRSQLPVAGSVEQARRSLDLLVESEDAQGKRGKKRKVTAPQDAIKLIISLTGDPSDEEALKIGSQIADSYPTRIHLVYVVTVPRDLPLQAALPEKEEEAAAALEAGKAFLVRRELAHTVHLQRGRDIASALEDLLQEIDASVVVVPLSNRRSDLDQSGSFVRSILSKVSREVVFVRGPAQ